MTLWPGMKIREARKIREAIRIELKKLDHQERYRRDLENLETMGPGRENSDSPSETLDKNRPSDNERIDSWSGYRVREHSQCSEEIPNWLTPPVECGCLTHWWTAWTIIDLPMKAATVMPSGGLAWTVGQTDRQKTDKAKSWVRFPD